MDFDQGLCEWKWSLILRVHLNSLYSVEKGLLYDCKAAVYKHVSVLYFIAVLRAMNNLQNIRKCAGIQPMSNVKFHYFYCLMCSTNLIYKETIWIIMSLVCVRVKYFRTCEDLHRFDTCACVGVRSMQVIAPSNKMMHQIYNMQPCTAHASEHTNWMFKRFHGSFDAVYFEELQLGMTVRLKY